MVVMMSFQVKGKETDNSNENLTKQQVGATQQNESKFMVVAKELNEKLEEYMLFTFSSEDFKKALNDKFGGNINQFNQNLVFFALTLAHMEKAAEKDGELKEFLPDLQGTMKTVNKNIEKIAKDLGYTVSQYSFDKLMDKDLEGVKEALKEDFGAEIKLENIFSGDALNSLAELFAFTVNNHLGSVSSVFVLRENKQIGAEENADEEQRKKKEEQKKKEEHVQQTLQQQQQKASDENKQNKNKPEENADEKQRKDNKKEQKKKEEHVQQTLQQQQQKTSDENKQNKGYHSALRESGKKIAIIGAALGALGASLFLGGFFYLPLAAFGLVGEGLAILGVPLLFVGSVTWAAGVMNEAIHNDHISEAIKEHLVGTFTWIAGEIDEGIQGIHKLANRVSKALNKEKKEQEEEQGEK